MPPALSFNIKPFIQPFCGPFYCPLYLDNKYKTCLRPNRYPVFPDHNTSKGLVQDVVKVVMWPLSLTSAFFQNCKVIV